MDYKSEFSNLIREEWVVKARIAKLLQKYAEKECPLEIGRVVTICGWSHRGKNGIITGISGIRYGDEMLWKVSGNVLKKDGTEGKHYFDFTEEEFKRMPFNCTKEQ
jgi:hypothetical protein